MLMLHGSELILRSSQKTVRDYTMDYEMRLAVYSDYAVAHSTTYIGAAAVLQTATLVNNSEGQEHD